MRRMICSWVMCCDDDQAGISDDSVAKTDDVAIDDGDKHEEGTPAVKLFNEKTNDDIKKMMETFRENQSTRDVDDSIGEQLFNEFNGIFSTEGSSAIN